jgi:hypothetical protein
MITPTHKLPISRQTKLLGLARSTAYYQPKVVSDSDLALMAAMDRLHLDYPFAGARGLRDILRRQGFPGVGSSTEVPVSAWCSANAICSSVNSLLFMAHSPSTSLLGISSFAVSRKLG